MADVLLINMWATDIGRYGASNYGLLKVIFEVNLKLFDQHSSKKLVFVLRDYDSRIGQDKIQTMLDNDIRTIWSEILKPDQYAESKPEDFFQFEFVFMPHKVFEADNFAAKAIEIKERFQTTAPDSFFLEKGTSENIPIDGLSVYVDQTWDVIRNDKELNIPGQIEMVANYRCDEIKNDAIVSVKTQIDELIEKSDSQLIEQFGESCTAIIEQATTMYKGMAKQYQSEVFEKVLSELTEHVTSQLYNAFDAQLKFIRKYTNDKVSNEIKKLHQKPLEDVAEKLSVILDKLLTSNMQSYTRKAQSLAVPGCDWDNKVVDNSTDLQSQLETLVHNCKEKFLSDVSERAAKTNEDLMRQMLHETFTKMGDNMCETLSDEYGTLIETFNGDL